MSWEIISFEIAINPAQVIGKFWLVYESAMAITGTTPQWLNRRLKMILSPAPALLLLLL